MSWPAEDQNVVVVLFEAYFLARSDDDVHEPL